MLCAKSFVGNIFHIVCDHVTSEIRVFGHITQRCLCVGSFHLFAFCRGKERKKKEKKRLFICLFFGACNIRSAAYHWDFVSALSGILRKFKFKVAKRPYRP